MNTRFLLLALSVAALSSCTSMYKSGQTPDDVYYSPGRPAPEYVKVEEKEDRYQTYDEYTDAYRNDRFLRMGVRNRYRMNSFDEMDWYNMRYGNMYNFNYMGYNPWALNNPWNSYYAWNNYYNPYCPNRGNYYYGNNNNWKNTVSYRPPSVRSYTFNSNSYKSNNRPLRTSGNTYYNNGSRYNNSNSGGLGNSLNKIFNNSGGNNNSTPSTNTYTPTRSYNPSSSGSSGGSSNGGGGGGNSGGNNSGSGAKRPGGGR